MRALASDGVGGAPQGGSYASSYLSFLMQGFSVSQLYITLKIVLERCFCPDLVVGATVHSDTAPHLSKCGMWTSSIIALPEAS